MIFADIINGIIFEAGAVFFTYLNIRRICKDKTVKGVDWRATAFFTSWGIWNIYYYSSLNQWVSTSAGIALIAMNTIYLYNLLKYRKRI